MSGVWATQSCKPTLKCCLDFTMMTVTGSCRCVPTVWGSFVVHVCSRWWLRCIYELRIVWAFIFHDGGKKNFTSLCTCKSQWQAPSPFFCSFHGEVAKKRLNITQGLATWTSRKLRKRLGIGCQGVSTEIFHHFNTSVSLWSNTAKFCLPGSLSGKHTAVCSWMCSIRVHGFKQLAGLLSCGIGHF